MKIDLKLAARVTFSIVREETAMRDSDPFAIHGGQVHELEERFIALVSQSDADASAFLETLAKLSASSELPSAVRRNIETLTKGTAI